jgi:RNA polymerase sigma-70 factor (ECF subfamily)
VNGAADARSREALRAWAVTALERGRAAWPELAVSGEELARVAALRMAGAPQRNARAGTDALDAAELYLAAACARGDTAALLLLRTRYFNPLDGSLRRLGLGAAQRDDVWQTLCARLLVGAAGAPPRIVRYAGTGDLAGLVRVAATRIALNWLERDKRYTNGDSWFDGLPASGSDPELHAMKRQHRAAVKEELEAAIRSLSPRQRMVLRLHLVERVGIDAIAAICSVHRATAARQVAIAKETLTTRVRVGLIARWHVSDPDLPALKALVDSQLDLSLKRLLASD